MINYYLLTKPGIILGNLLTVAAGFLLASKGSMDIKLFAATLIGLAFIMASACVFNNYIDRPIDKKMSRTKHRPLAAGLVSGPQAIIFGIILGFIGNFILLFYTNILTVCVADFGFFVYVVMYSLWKRKTIYSTAIGSIAGAVPPVVGYCAVSNRLDLGAFILFAMLVLWQMPHFFSIAIYHLKDYTMAKLPLLPIEKGVFKTKMHMMFYIMAFTLIASLLTFFNYTGYVYLIITTALGVIWLFFCLAGFKSKNDTLWSKNMFQLSLVLIMIICFTIPFDTI